MAARGIAAVNMLRTEHVHLDIDTTVEVVFGTQQGALPGPNPRYHGRPSYHPILAHVAEAGVCVGALLRAGDTGLGDDDAATIRGWLRPFRDGIGHDVMVTARIDAGGDCAKILSAFDRGGARFIAKGKWGFDLRDAVRAVEHWETVNRDAFDRPTRQVAELDFHRTAGPDSGDVFASSQSGPTSALDRVCHSGCRPRTALGVSYRVPEVAAGMVRRPAWAIPDQNQAWLRRVTILRRY